MFEYIQVRISSIYDARYFVDVNWLKHVKVNLVAIQEKAQSLFQFSVLQNEYEAAWLLKAITCIDLTTLAGDDTHSNVSRLCFKVGVTYFYRSQSK